MREYKFRAWHDGKSSFHYEPQMLYDTNPGDCLRWKSEGQRLTVMQFTGLQDRNGRDIYECDLHNLNGKWDGIGVVEYHDGQYFVIHKDVDGEYLVCRSLYQELSGEKGEVMGNIYENPELLEATV